MSGTVVLPYLHINIFISYIIKVQHFYTLHYILYKGKEKVCEKQTSKKKERSKLHKIYGRMRADKEQKKVRMNYIIICIYYYIK